jgi:hypothetical protein
VGAATRAWCGRSLVSRETSLVAIERRETPVVGNVQLRRVPIALTSGWGGLGRPAASASFLAAPAAAAIMPDEMIARSAVRMSANADATGSWPPPGAPMARRAQVSDMAPMQPSAPRWMHELVRLQRAGGYWELDREFARVLGLDLDDLFDRLRRAGIDSDNGPRAWATALALMWLERHAAPFEDEWRFLADKARDWLRHVRSPRDWREWMEMAHEVMMST